MDCDIFCTKAENRKPSQVINRRNTNVENDFGVILDKFLTA